MKFKRQSGPIEQTAKVYFMPYCSGSEDITTLSSNTVAQLSNEKRRNQPQYLKSSVLVMGFWLLFVESALFLFGRLCSAEPMAVDYLLSSLVLCK